MIIEACIESLEEAIAAEEFGASQVELCSHLKYEGLSPSIELVKSVKSKISIPIKVMVRPRKGDFVYTSDEVDEMIKYLQKLESVGINAVVTGMLDIENKIDLNNLSRLANTFPSMDITFHKAIDLVEDPIEEIKKLYPIENIRSILTSGKGRTAMDGMPQLQEMIKLFNNRFTIIAAGKITSTNLDDIHKLLNASAYHGRRIVG